MIVEVVNNSLIDGKIVHMHRLVTLNSTNRHLERIDRIERLLMRSPKNGAYGKTECGSAPYSEFGVTNGGRLLFAVECGGQVDSRRGCLAYSDRIA